MKPKRFFWHADKEEALRQLLGKDVSILRDRTGGTTKPLTLYQFAAQLDQSPELPIEVSSEACACFA